MLTLKRASLATVVFIAAGGIALRVSGIWRWVEDQVIWPTGRVGRLVARVYASVPFVGRYYGVFADALGLGSEDEVLDVACGSGVFLRRHAAHVRRCAGLDHSEPMIEEAIRQNRERVLAGTAEFVVGDVTRLPWPDASFSVVTSNDVDCYADKARPAVAEMHRVLKPGGRIVVEGDRRALLAATGFEDLSTKRVLLGAATLTMGRRR